MLKSYINEQWSQTNTQKRTAMDSCGMWQWGMSNIARLYQEGMMFTNGYKKIVNSIKLSYNFNLMVCLRGQVSGLELGAKVQKLRAKPFITFSPIHPHPRRSKICCRPKYIASRLQQYFIKTNHASLQSLMTNT